MRKLLLFGAGIVSFLIIVSSVILFGAVLAIAAPAAGEEYLVQVDPSAHQRFGLYYPATYKFRLPSGSQGLAAQYRYGDGAWTTLPEKRKGDVFNGVDAVRFDYQNGFAYVSVRFSRSSDEIHIRGVDGGGQPVTLQFDSITRYYDDRKGVVTMTLDDWNTSFADFFDTALDYLFNDGLYFTTAIITSDVYWNRVQLKINQYGDHLEIASHSTTHPCTAETYAVSGYAAEAAGSRDALRQNLSFAAKPYLPLFVEPCGYSDDQLQAALSGADYLLSRSANNNPAQGVLFSEWDSALAWYGRAAVTYDDDVNADDANLLTDTNAAFDQAIAAGGIYHLMDHPSKGFWHPDSYLLQHLHYISGRSDLWYVPFGQLYLYHFIQEMRGNLKVSQVNSDSLSANFSAAPLSGVAPLNVTFTDSSQGNPTGWSWDFGDGTSSTRQNPVHQYLAPGSYTVKLTVSGPGGTDSSTKAGYITVKAATPTAEFSATPVTGYAPLKVSFTDSSRGAVTDWAWDFGDGSLSSEHNPVHLYKESGSYTVKLTVTGPEGSDSGKKEGYINVKEVAPGYARITAPANGASFADPASITIAAIASAGSGAAIEKVDFYADTTLLSTETEAPFSYRWSEVPSGNYSLTARVTDSSGGTATSPPVTVSVDKKVVTKRTQRISITKSAPDTAMFGSSFTVAASAPAGPVSYSSAGGCSNKGGSFTMTSGTMPCLVFYDQQGNGNYNPAKQLNSTTSAVKASQSIQIGTQPLQSVAVGGSFTVAATAPGGAVSYNSAGGCGNAGATFTLSSATPCTVLLDQAGNDDYQAAPQLTATVSASKQAGRLDQVIAWSTAPPSNALFGATFTVAATAPGGAVSYGSSGGCSNNGATFTMTSGSAPCTVSCDQPGNDSYGAAPQKRVIVAAAKGEQSVSVTVPPPASARFGSSFTVTATAPGGPVSYESHDGCRNDGATFTVTSGTTPCLVRYTQPGGDNYRAAPEVLATVPVAKASQSISMTSAAPARATVGSRFTVAATAPGGGVSYGSSGGCSNSGGSFTVTSASTPCTIYLDQSGSADYDPVHLAISVPTTGAATTTGDLSGAVAGDINADGVVDLADAVAALRVAAGIDSATPAILARADVAPLVNGKPNPDGKIDVGDVIVLLRKSVGLINW